jgi:hypothetical protein
VAQRQDADQTGRRRRRSAPCRTRARTNGGVRPRQDPACTAWKMPPLAKQGRAAMPAREGPAAGATQLREHVVDTSRLTRWRGERGRRRDERGRCQASEQKAPYEDGAFARRAFTGRPARPKRSTCCAARARRTSPCR